MTIDTLPAKAREILPSASHLDRARLPTSACGCLSRSGAFSRSRTRFRLPGGRVGGQQDIERGIPVPVQHQPTTRADVRSHGKRLLTRLPRPEQSWVVERGETAITGMPCNA